VRSGQTQGADLSFPDMVAVVITWNPDIKAFSAALSSYADTCRVVIVDNASDAAIVASLRAAVSANCVLVEQTANLGIAAALNNGIDVGRRWDPKHYLLLDQDSVLESHALLRLLQAKERLVAQGERYPVVGPMPVSGEDDKPIGMYRTLSVLADGSAPRRVESLYTSGMLVPSELALKARQLDSFFIDYVDTEWCYRARALFGAGIYLVADAKLFHKVGESELDLRQLRSQPLIVHRPLRQYFQFRNALWMLRLTYIPLPDRIKIAARCLARVVMITFAVSPRRQRMRYVMAALFDGIRGKAGNYAFLPGASRSRRLQERKER